MTSPVVLAAPRDRAWGVWLQFLVVIFGGVSDDRAIAKGPRSEGA